MDPVADAAAELQARLASFAAEHGLPGASAGVVHRDDLVWTGHAGFADLAGRRAPEPGTQYRIGSVTKTFTATAIMRLQADGALHLDDPAVAHLPELRRAHSPFGPVEAVTLRRMLSHESGLATDPPGTDRSRRRYEGDPARTLAHADQIAVVVPPASQQKYSNLAYQLLGEVVTRASGAPYPRYLTEVILRPLGLHATGFGPLPDELAGRQATGYMHRPFSDELRPAPEAVRSWAEGGLWSCLTDLARWLAVQLGAHAEPAVDSPVLAAATLRDMHQARYLGGADWTQAAGISWFTVRRHEASWIHHGGGAGGFNSDVCFEPHAGVGAIVLLNAAAEAPVLARDLAAIARRAVQAATAVPVAPPDPVPADWRPLLGAYAYAGLGLLVRVEWRRGSLVLVNPDGSAGPRLLPAGAPDRFVASAGFRESGEPVIFGRDSSGRARSVYLGGVTLPRLDPAG